MSVKWMFETVNNVLVKKPHTVGNVTRDMNVVEYGFETIYFAQVSDPAWCEASRVRTAERNELRSKRLFRELLTKLCRHLPTPCPKP